MSFLISITPFIAILALVLVLHALAPKTMKAIARAAFSERNRPRE